MFNPSGHEKSKRWAALNEVGVQPGHRWLCRKYVSIDAARSGNHVHIPGIKEDLVAYKGPKRARKERKPETRTLSLASISKSNPC